MAQDPHNVDFYYLEGEKIRPRHMTAWEPDVDSIKLLVTHWRVLKWALSAPVITLKSFVKLRQSSGSFQVCAMPVKLLMRNDGEGFMKKGLCMALHTVRV
jgi:hypothetical protein